MSATVIDSQRVADLIDRHGFRKANLRTLPAEVIADAINQVGPELVTVTECRVWLAAVGADPRFADVRPWTT
jgi:hypothetical protein